jgi:hypothetical protein
MRGSAAFACRTTGSNETHISRAIKPPAPHQRVKPDGQGKVGRPAILKKSPERGNPLPDFRNGLVYLGLADTSDMIVSNFCHSGQAGPNPANSMSMV